MDTKNCYKCGKEILTDLHVCPQCGYVYLKAGFYNRIADVPQKHTSGDNLGNVLAYCNQHGLILAKKYLQVSCKKPLESAEFKELITDINEHNIDVVLVEYIYKLSRSCSVLINVLELANKNNIKLIAMNTPMNFNTPEVISFFEGFRESLSCSIKRGIAYSKGLKKC